MTGVFAPTSGHSDCISPINTCLKIPQIKPLVVSFGLLQSLFVGCGWLEEASLNAPLFPNGHKRSKLGNNKVTLFPFKTLHFRDRLRSHVSSSTPTGRETALPFSGGAGPACRLSTELLPLWSSEDAPTPPLIWVVNAGVGCDRQRPRRRRGSLAFLPQPPSTVTPRLGRSVQVCAASLALQGAGDSLRAGQGRALAEAVAPPAPAARRQPREGHAVTWSGEEGGRAHDTLPHLPLPARRSPGGRSRGLARFPRLRPTAGLRRSNPAGRSGPGQARGCGAGRGSLPRTLPGDRGGAARPQRPVEGRRGV